MKVFAVITATFAFGIVAFNWSASDAFSVRMSLLSKFNDSTAPSRRSFLSIAVATMGAAASVASLQPVERAHAVASSSPPIYKLNSGITYATLKEGKGSFPQGGDIVAIEYTGYLTSGAIFDKTHSEGSQNALLFKLGR
jgi:FKBP-type peptidyl-prolyl cis-trans isomerase